MGPGQLLAAPQQELTAGTLRVPVPQSPLSPSRAIPVPHCPGHPEQSPKPAVPPWLLEKPR